MKKNIDRVFLLIFACGLFVLSARGTYAYLDLGTGSYIFQMALGAVLGGLFTLKLYYRKFLALFKKTAPTEEEKKHENK